MAVTVQRDFVSTRDDVRGNTRPALDLFADEKEGRARITRLEEVEDGRRPGGVRPVVERERNCAFVRDAQRDAKRTRQHR